eukprot:CAMPEP_0185769770 /NCGR_PEP_ID=MMETSP1174-20130828/55819_1 /TAXON_ID=35687 /ORGANISM="Dictyocha speculum, Strain CCMP1381" /LENGTH=324 /DNA_ID=CAMNT_0028454959 /DNA_START=425 /DNA_END=1399 /DNA_ORIENTATION=+
MEAPVWRFEPALGRGYLIFSQIEKLRLWKWEEGGGAFTLGRSLFREDVPSTVEEGTSCSSRGVRATSLLAMDKTQSAFAAFLVLCNADRVVRMEHNGSLTPLATAENAAAAWTQLGGGEVFDDHYVFSPQDVLVHPVTGDLFVTDAVDVDTTGMMTEEGGSRVDRRGGGRIWRITSPHIQAASSATDILPPLELLATDVEHPRGLGFSPDRTHLYVADASPGHPHWRVYPMQEDGTLGEGAVWAEASSFEGEGAPGGIQVDDKGNVFAIGPGGVRIFDAKGVYMGVISTGSVTTGLSFGADNFLYITGRGGVYRIKTKVKLGLK